MKRNQWERLRVFERNKQHTIVATGAIQCNENRDEERSMAAIKTDDRLGKGGSNRGPEDRGRIVRSKHLTRAIDHPLDLDSPPQRPA